MSILLEGIPFMLLGAILSGIIDQFLPSRFMAKILPKNPTAAIFMGGMLGMIFPMCECGIVPVIRRLIGKGLPVSCAIAYMLAVPIVNPIVAVSTFMAFSGQGAMEMTVLRLGLGYCVAVFAALVISRFALKHILKSAVLAQVEKPVNPLMGASSSTLGKGGIVSRLGGALGVAVNDFLDVCFYFVLGAAVAAVFNTAVNQDNLLPLANNIWLGTGSMMILAAILSLCSTSDAFIAATFVNFPTVSKLAFLVFGPMIDLKLLFIYSAIFKKRFIATLAIGLFIVIGLICVRLAFIQL